MNHPKKFFLAAAVTLAAAVQAGGPALPTVEYSADTTMETAEVRMTGHVNYTPTRERREMVTGSGGERMITITRQDKKVAWTLMPAEKSTRRSAWPKPAHRPRTTSPITGSSRP